MNIGSLIAGLGVDTAGLMQAERDMERMRRKFDHTTKMINARLQTTGRAMKRFGRSWSMYVTLPLTLAGGAAAKMAMQFETSMTQIIGLVGVAREQVEAWGEDILELAPKVGKAPSELADAMFFVTSAGLRGAEAMEVLEASSRAAAVGLGETKVVADLVTSAMNAYGAENLSAAEATDILVSTVREGKAQADALAGSMGYVLPIASELGVTFDQVGAAIAAMTRTGTNAQTATVQLRQILNSLIKPSEQAKSALFDMGTSAQELRDIAGGPNGLITVLTEVKNLQKRYGDETMATVFPNIRALAGVLDIMGSNAEENIKIFRALIRYNGALNAAFEETTKTFEFRWNQALSEGRVALTKFGQTIGKAAIPLLKELTERINRLVEWFDDLTEGQQKAVVKAAALAAVIGPLSVTLGFLVGNVLPGLVRIGYSVVKMFNALTVAMLKNPITAVAVGLAALATHLLLVRNRSDEAADAQENFNESLKETERELQRQRVEEFLRDLGILRERVLSGGAGQPLVTFEDIDTSKLDKLSEKLSELPLSYIEGAKSLLADEIVHMQRQIEGFVSTGNELIDKVQMGEMTKEVEALEAAYKAVVKELEEADRLEEEMLKKLHGTGGEEIDPGVAKAMRTLNEELEVANKMATLFGDSFDEVKVKTEIYRQAIESLLRAGLDPTDAKIQELIENWNHWKALLEDSKEEISAQEQAMQDLQNELAFIAALEGALGDTYDDVGAQMQAYQSALQAVMRSEEADAEVIEHLIQKIRELRSEQQKLNDSTQMITNTIARTSSSMLTALGEAIAGTEQGFKHLVNTILNGAEQIIHALLTQAIIGLISKETTSKGVWGLATAAVGIGVLKALVNKSTSDIDNYAQIQQPAHMAEGGVVPRGYPNDTFPAMLSSGEAVIPLNRMERRPQILDVRGHFELDGRTILFAIDRAAIEYENLT